MAWVGAVVQGVTGIAQTIAASQAAKKLPESQKYTPSPQMRRAEEMALRRAEQGMSAAERAAFEQGMARRTGAAERAMRNVGLAGVAQGVSNIFNIDAMNQFAAQSEAERRRGEQMYAGIAGQMQAIQDRETASFNQMLQQQRTALGQAAASGFKNLTGAIGMAAQAANTAKLADAISGSGMNDGTGIAADQMAQAPTQTSFQLPTNDTSAAPAIPPGAGYPGVTSTSVLGPEGMPMQAPTQTSFQLPTETLGAPQIPYSAGGAGYGVASDLGAYGPSQAVQPNPILLGASSQNPNSAFNSMMNRMSPLNPFGSFQ